MKVAIFFAATGPMVGRNYIADVNCLLNSIDKHRLYEKINLDVYFFHYGFDPSWEYPKRAQEELPFNLICIEVDKNSCPGHTKPIEYIKRLRYSKLLEFGGKYDAICHLDADMFFVTNEIVSLFEMVAGTDKLIGCNERFKWLVGPKVYFEKDGTSIFKELGKLHSMICNVPSIFDLKKWRDVFEYYTDICFGGYQIKNGGKAGIGDLFAHNIAIHKMGRDTDVVMFPMETMAQVHHTWINPNTYIIKDGDMWRSAAGDKIYMIHDTKRICRSNFVNDNLALFNKNCPWAKSFEGKIKTGLLAAQSEWYGLNFNGKLKLSEFITLDKTFYKE